jgi:hypothetical protein
MRKTSLAVLLLAAMAGPAPRSDASASTSKSGPTCGAPGCDKIIGTIHLAVDPIEPRTWPGQHQRML